MNLEDLLTQTRNQLAALPGATIISPFNREPVGSNEFVHGQINMKRGIGQDLLSDSYSVIRSAPDQQERRFYMRQAGQKAPSGASCLWQRRSIRFTRFGCRCPLS